MKNLRYAVIHIDPMGIRTGYTLMTTHQTMRGARAAHQRCAGGGYHLAERKGDGYARMNVDSQGFRLPGSTNPAPVLMPRNEVLRVLENMEREAHCAGFEENEAALKAARVFLAANRSA